VQGVEKNQELSRSVNCVNLYIPTTTLSPKRDGSSRLPPTQRSTSTRGDSEEGVGSSRGVVFEAAAAAVEVATVVVGTVRVFWLSAGFLAFRGPLLLFLLLLFFVALDGLRGRLATTRTTTRRPSRLALGTSLLVLRRLQTHKTRLTIVSSLSLCVLRSEHRSRPLGYKRILSNSFGKYCTTTALRARS
jgi:hypothetical protein